MICPTDRGPDPARRPWRPKFKVGSRRGIAGLFLTGKMGVFLTGVQEKVCTGAILGVIREPDPPVPGDPLVSPCFYGIFWHFLPGRIFCLHEKSEGPVPGDLPGSERCSGIFRHFSPGRIFCLHEKLNAPVPAGPPLSAARIARLTASRNYPVWRAPCSRHPVPIHNLFMTLRETR